MTEGSLKLIGTKQTKREDAKKYDLLQVQGLAQKLDQDFSSWSNFNTWTKSNEKRSVQWIFTRANDLVNGKNVDICCGCCEYNYGSLDLPKDLQIKKAGLKCRGDRVVYMIETVKEEIKNAPSYKGMKPEDFR